LHDFLFSVGSHSLKFQLVRKFQGRSPGCVPIGHTRPVTGLTAQPLNITTANALNTIASFLIFFRFRLFSVYAYRSRYRLIPYCL
ncbi:hypothetical protein V6S75_20150, partial [Burkholderia pseudomallei]|uniref:hypothetical protein n=1 Tax=Burkholderia pseudomallei TaxID=28450 RepID=UPI00345882D7